MDKLKYVKLEKTDGSYTSQIPIGADAANIDMANGTNLENRVKSIEDDIDLQTARIDELSTLEPGSTTGDAELADIRVAADGTIYDNAGNSVRGQINQVNDTIDATKDIIEDNTLIYDATIKNLPKTEEQEGTELEFDNAIESPIMHYNDEGSLEKGLLLESAQLEQETTNGNQLVDFNNLTGATASSTFSNNILTLSNSAGTYTNKFYNITDLYKNNSGKTLKFRYKSIDVSNQYGSVAQLTIYYNDDTATRYPSLLDHNLTKHNITIPSDTSNIRTVNFGIYLNNTSVSQAASVTIEEPMLYFDDNDTYEPYTNGASPNPSYPQEVKRIWGDNELKIHNKNWFNLNTPAGKLNGATKTVLNNGIRIIALFDGNYRYAILPILDCRKYIGKTIRLKANIIPNSSQVSSYVLGISDVTGENRTQKVSTDVSTTLSYLISANDITDTKKYLYVGLFVTANASVSKEDYTDFTDIMLTIDDENMEYVPNKEQLLPLNLGVRNLFNFDNAIYQAANQATITKQDKGFKVESSNSAYAYCGISITNFNLKPNTTYTTSCKVKSTIASSGSRIGILSSFNTTGSVLYSEYVKAGICYVAFTTPNEIPTTGNLFGLYVGASDSETIFEDIQLEEGSVAHSYSEYGVEPVEYCAIDDYKDEFFYNSSKREDYIDTLENNKWYLKKNTGKVVLDGSESWAESSTNTSGIKRMSTNKIKNKVMPIDVNKIALIMCTHYKKESAADTYRKNVGIGIDNTGILFIYDSNYNTSESLTSYKVWLAENNIIVYYILATPEYVLLNDTLQKQLNTIRNAITLSDEQVYITQDNEQLSFNLKGLLNSSLDNKINKIDNTFDNIDEEQTEQDRRLNVLETVIDGLPKVEGEGTDIQLKNTIKSPLKMKLDPSELEQETTTGKQLVDLSNASDTTNNGITYTIDNSEGTITLNGTATSTSLLTINLNSSIKNGTVVSLGNNNLTTNINVMSRLVNNSGSQLTYADCSIINNKVENITLNDEATKFQIRVANGTTLSNFIIKPMLSFGTILPEYESYTGGQPGPNPDYPQEVKRIWGDNELKVENKNLLPTNVNMWESGHYGTNGNKGNFPTRMRLIDLLQIKPNTTYYIGSNNNINFYIRGYDKNKKFIVNIGSIYESNPIFTTPDNVYYLGISIEKTYSDYVETTDKIKMLYNSAIDKTWISHKEQLLPLNLGVRNLFDKNDANILVNNNLSSDGTTYSVNGRNTSYYIAVSPLTNYILSGAIYKNVAFYDTNKNFISITSSNAFLTPSNAYYLRFAWDTSLDYSNMQFEEGSIAHSYSEYGVEPIEYCAIGDYKDEFFYNSSKREDYIDTLENNKWYLKKNIKKVVLDGSESYTATQTSNVFWTTINDYLPIANTIICISNRYQPFKNIVSASELLNNYEIAFNTNKASYPRLYLKNVDCVDIIDLQVELSTHNTIVYYVLKTSEYILLNDTLQKQLTNITKALAYDEETNILQDNSQLPFQIKANANADINSIINDLKNAIISLGGNI